MYKFYIFLTGGDCCCFFTAFYMVGDIKDVQEKAAKMAKELGGSKKAGSAAAAAAAAQYSIGGQVKLLAKLAN